MSEKALDFQQTPKVWPILTHRVGAPMRDGIRLATDIWLPEGDGPFPAILVRTPYCYETINSLYELPKRMVKAGYAFVIQFTRGQWGSEGIFRYTANDWKDGYDAVEWVADQPWCDGNVGMMGTSFLAMTQLYAASEQPPHLKAISPVAPYFRHYYNTYCRIMHLEWTRGVQQNFPEYFARQANGDSALASEFQHRLRSRPAYSAADGWVEGPYLKVYKDMMERPANDRAFWDQIELTDEAYSRMNVPMFWISGGHIDRSTFECIHSWQKIKSLAPSNQHHMLLGPYPHGAVEEYGLLTTTLGPYEFDENVKTDNIGMRIAFFNRHLKGLDEDADLPDNVRIYITGSNLWREFSDIPVPEATNRKLYLSSRGGAKTASGDGVASFTPGSSALSDTVLVDPKNPVSGYDSFDMGWAIHREDVLVYTSAPMENPITVVGEPKAILHVACDTPDADITVDFCEVRDTGLTVRLSTFTMRLRHRHGAQNGDVFMTPGKPEKVDISMEWMGHTFLPGTRIRITLRGTNFPLIDPNPNTNEPIHYATKLERTKLHIYHTETMPSWIEVPTISIA